MSLTNKLPTRRKKQAAVKEPAQIMPGTPVGPPPEGADHQQTEPTPSEASQPRKLHGFGSIIAVLVVAIAIAVLLTAFVFQQYQVDGPSMQPTLHNGNRLIVWKVPETWSKITGHPYIPKRGDIIIFNEPSLQQLTSTGSDQLVKRVIGLPGDHIVIKNNVITIYNKNHPKGFDPDKTLPYGKGITQTTAGNINTTLKANQLFVCGDNRGDSLDSRVFGPINASQIVGQLVLRITPLSNIEKF